MPLKIFLISNMYPSSDDPEYGIFVKNMESSLEKKGAEFTCKSVISGKPKSFTNKLLKYYKFYAGIVKNYKSKEFDIVYVHFLSHSAPGLVFAKWLFRNKGKIVVNVHGGDVLTFYKGILKFFTKKLLKKTALLVVPSKYFFKIVSETYYYFSNENIFVSPSGGINLSVFHPIDIERTNTLNLGFVSRIEDNKGWKTFLQSLLKLKEKNIDFKAYIAGSGSQLNVMLQYIKQHNFGKEVDYLGVIPQKELNELYNRLDVFIFPTTRDTESLGLVGLEAMACRVPVIGSEIAGLKTYIKDDKNGFFVKPGDVKDLSNKIMKYNNLTTIQKEEMRTFAYETAKLYDKDLIAEQLLEKIQSI